MTIRNLCCSILVFAVIAESGRPNWSEAAPSEIPATSAREQGPTAVIPDREPLTPLETALGLGHQVSVKEMNKIAARVRKDGKPGLIGCGVATGPDGKWVGAYATNYSLKIAGDEELHEVMISNLQIEKLDPLNSVEVKGFRYRLQDGVFVRTKRPTQK
ncbi:MAG: hypothetical protein IAF94_14990 [Pirellulaceae bacterium]|nr:hypothetical protein [Pirellulaceae bacterium]